MPIPFELNILSACLSVAAAEWGVKRNLETQSAIRRVTPLIERDVTLELTEAKPATTRPKSRLRRLMPNKAQSAILAQYITIGLIGYYLPKYGTTLLADLIWGTFELVILSFFAHRAILCLFPVPTQLRYRFPKSTGRADSFVLEEKPADDLSIFQKEPALWTMSVACAASIMLALFAGHRVALSLLPPMMVLGSISVFVGPLVSMRGVVFITAVFQAIGPTVFICLSIYHAFYPKSPRTIDNPTQSRALPSPWLGELMMSFAGMICAALPLGLICLTNRFEHFSREALPASPLEPGAALVIERGCPFVSQISWTGPAFIGLLSYGVGLGLHALLMEACKADKEALDSASSFGMTITISTTMLGIMATAWIQGRWSEWWGYYEQWPKDGPERKEHGSGADLDGPGDLSQSIDEKC